MKNKSIEFEKINSERKELISKTINNLTKDRLAVLDNRINIYNEFISVYNQYEKFSRKALNEN